MSSPFLLSYGALWLVVLVQTLLLIGVIRALYEVRHGGGDAGGGTMKGRPLPIFSTVDISGRHLSNSDLTGRSAAFLFVSPDRSSCMITLAELKALRSDTRRQLVVVCNAGDDACKRLAADYDLDVPVVADEGGDLVRSFGVSGTPMAMRVNADGMIESYGEPARGQDLEELLGEIGHGPELAANVTSEGAA